MRLARLPKASTDLVTCTPNASGQRWIGIRLDGDEPVPHQQPPGDGYRVLCRHGRIHWGIAAVQPGGSR